ncbi:hypothetical protein [Aeromonas veronii]|uniref:hypothetical protein n=1 Tax=Aeromonas veronii TaxID=654 RepID=UPI001FFEBF19|nr:hypothetical protein [Aeromonas veronii]UPK53923.1 hypothetical protein MYF86_15700 [Aeromonas veronii]
MANKKENNKKENVYRNGQFTGVYKGDNGNMLTATHMIYEVDGDELIVAVDDGFKLLYTFLYDQYRSFQSQQKDLFAEWETIFKALGRTYNTKKSKDNVKLLEDCGLLKQIKMPNNNARIKIVADVSLKNIRFINPDYDAWRAEQEANNAERVAEYAAFHEEKEKAKHQAKQPHNNTKSKTEVKDDGSRNEIAIDTIETSHDTNAQGSGSAKNIAVDVMKEIKLDDLPDPFLDDCGVSHDSGFEEYNSTRGAEPYGSINSQPKPIKSVKQSHYDEDGRLCDKCYQNRQGGAWYCTDSECFNNVPF